MKPSARMACLDANAAVDYVDGRIDGDVAERIEAHVADCDNCRRIIAAMVRSGSEASTSPGSQLSGTHTGPASARATHGFSIDRFEVIRLLGQGAMGRVYEAVDTSLGTRVAIKTLRHMDAESLLRFKQEFRALGDIEHPNLVSLGELVEFEGEWLLTMELIEGSDFLTYVQGAKAAESACNERRLRAVLPQLAAGLRALHDAQKVHRDIKPSNIIVTDAGHLVILDFGLVRETKGITHTTTPHVVGTVAYMAPEQAASALVGPEADWYSVGVVLYQALTGVLPFTGSSLDVLMDKQRFEPAPPRALQPTVAADLDALCVELMQFNPSDRPDGREVRKRLGRVKTAPGAIVRTSSISQYASAFVGRGVELSVLGEAFERVMAGHAAEAHVHGESGVGKSALIRAFTSDRTVRSDQVVVLAGRCYEREAVPYKALDELIDSLSRYLRQLSREQASQLVPRHASLLPRVFPVLGRVEVIAQAPSPKHAITDAQELRARVFAALRDLLSLLAERVTLICVIDDLQWADADSMKLLAELTRPPTPPPMLLLTSSRRGAHSAVIDVEAIESGAVRHIDLQPLEPANACRLATLLLDNAGLRGMVSAELIAKEALGHPLYIDELVRHAALSGHIEHGEVDLDNVIWTRASNLPRAARDVLELISIAGTPLAQRTIRHAAEMEPATFAKQVAILRVANLARGKGARGNETIEPYHDRVREATVAHLSSDERIARHQRLAIALESAGAGHNRPELLLRHLEAANQRAKAATAAASAAQRAKQALAFDRASELFRVALRLTSNADSSVRRTLELDLARCLADAGRGADAADVYLSAAHGSDPTTRRECQRHASEQLLITGHIERGLQTLANLLSDVGMSLPRTPGGAIRSLVWRRGWLRLRGLRWTKRHERELADSELARLDVCQVACDGLAMVDNVRGADFQTRSLLLALKTGEPKRVCHAFGMEAFYAASQGGRGAARARKMVARMQAIADDTNEPYLRAITLTVEGGVSYLGGNYLVAEQALARAEQGLLEQSGGHTLVLNNARLFRLFCLRHLGSLRQWGVLVDQYIRDAERRGDIYAETSMRRTNNLVWLVRDQPASARRDLDRTSWTPLETGYHLQHLYSLLAEVDLAAYTGDAAGLEERVRDSFAGLRRSFLLRIQLVRGLAYFLWGRCFLLVAQDPAQRTAALKEVEFAFRRLRKDRIGYATAYSLLLEGAWAQLRDDPSHAIATFAEATRVSEHSDLMLQAACARRRHGELLGGADGLALISSANQWMDQASVVRPTRLANVYIPGSAIDDGAD